MLAEAVGCGARVEVARGDGDFEPALAQGVLGADVEVERIARLRPQRNLQDCSAAARLHDLPRDPPEQPVDGVAAGRLGERQLQLLPVPGVPAVADPVGPRHQDLAAPAGDPVLFGESVDDCASTDRVGPKGRSQLHDDGLVRAAAEGQLPSSAALLHAWPPRSALSVPSGADVVVACGSDPPLGSVRPRIDPVKRNTFLPVKSPGPFAWWGHRHYTRRLTSRTGIISIHRLRRPSDGPTEVSRGSSTGPSPRDRPAPARDSRRGSDGQAPPEWPIVGAGALSRLRSSHGPLPSHRRTRPGG